MFVTCIKYIKAGWNDKTVQVADIALAQEKRTSTRHSLDPAKRKEKQVQRKSRDIFRDYFQLITK